MNTAISSEEINWEWGQLQQRAKSNPGVAYLGYETGQLVAHVDGEDRIGQVLLRAVSAPGVGDDPTVYYHAVVNWTTADGELLRQREEFRHPFPALDWIYETVPDFDLIETVTVDESDEDAVGDATDDAADADDADATDDADSTPADS